MRSLELNRAVVEGQSCGRFFCIDQFNDEGIVRSFDSNLVTLHKNLQRADRYAIESARCDLLSF